MVPSVLLLPPLLFCPHGNLHCVTDSGSATLGVEATGHRKAEELQDLTGWHQHGESRSSQAKNPEWKALGSRPTVRCLPQVTGWFREQLGLDLTETSGKGGSPAHQADPWTMWALRGSS